ncbi:MAG: hypothetical protein RR061_08765 [Muribaculaceae bacterium]
MCSYRPPTEPRIARINSEAYYVYSAREFRFYKPRETGTKRDNMRSIKRAFNNLKKLINCNYGEPSHVRFVTLTYAENMTDNKRISGDFRRFYRRAVAAYGDFRYIYVKEQQARGAWHLHCFFFFDTTAPYMPNTDDNHPLRDMWGHGFVTITSVREDVNNLGNYLCAYLTDDKETGKKGSRLLNYDSGMRLYNCSRDCARPIEGTLSCEQYADMRADKSVEQLSTHDREIVLESGKKLSYRYEMYAIDV